MKFKAYFNKTFQMTPLSVFLIFFLGIFVGIIIIKLVNLNTDQAVPAQALNLVEFGKRNLDIKLTDSEFTELVSTGNFNLSLVKVTDDVKLHTHPEDHIIYIISGQAEGDRGDGNKFQIGPGWYIQVPRNIPHSLRKIGDEPLLVLQLSTPEFNPNKIKLLEKK